MLDGEIRQISSYPLVICYIAMENHHFWWENPLFLWPFSIAMLVHQRVDDPSHQPPAISDVSPEHRYGFPSPWDLLAVGFWKYPSGFSVKQPIGKGWTSNILVKRHHDCKPGKMHFYPHENDWQMYCMFTAMVIFPSPWTFAPNLVNQWDQSHNISHKRS